VDYDEVLKSLQLRLLRHQTRLRDEAPCSVVIVFEGMDAAGKGGAIRRLTGRLDPRGYRVHPIGPPTHEELSRHYLWRFFRRMPARGGITIFDRSWYGRVLVERVESLATQEQWRRAYEEIRAFERMHVDDGTVLIKFWLHVSREEQLRRFRDRETDPFAEYKLTPDDWRNRRRSRHYVDAAEEMLRETHAPNAPWVLVPGDDKEFARIRVIEEVVQRLDAALAENAQQPRVAVAAPPTANELPPGAPDLNPTARRT
jgi:polyphosphate kinase 2 (PPK2 family)